MGWHWNTGIQGSLLFSSVKIIIRLLRHSQKVSREEDGGVHYHQVIDACKKKQSENTWYWSDEMKKHSVNAPNWSILQMDISSGKKWTEKKVQYCLNPNYPHQCLCLRAIQGHSGSTINPALQDNVLLPEDFTEYMHHVGNGKVLRSTVIHGLIPGGVSLKTGRQAVFFTVVNPMHNQDGLGETLCDLSQARIAPYRKTWKSFQNTVFWCNLKLAQQRGLQFCQTRSNAVILYDYSLRHTACRVIEKAICIKTKDQLYQRESVILRPCVCS